MKRAGIGSALVDVFMNDKAVSPQLVDSRLGTWCGKDLVVVLVWYIVFLRLRFVTSLLYHLLS